MTSVYKYTFKIARNFSVQFYNQCIPKNAIYSRLNKNVIIYVSNYQQFKEAENLKSKIQIYKLDVRSNSGKFKPYILDLSKNLDVALCLQLLQFIKENNLYDVKCENQLMLSRISKPTRREIPESNYNVSYPQRKIYKWEETFLTETDAVTLFRRF